MENDKEEAQLQYRLLCQVQLRLEQEHRLQQQIYYQRQQEDTKKNNTRDLQNDQLRENEMYNQIRHQINNEQEFLKRKLVCKHEEFNNKIQQHRATALDEVKSSSVQTNIVSSSDDTTFEYLVDNEDFFMVSEKEGNVTSNFFLETDTETIFNRPFLSLEGI